MEIIELLWTGGWDSTYRMIELSRQEVLIQPVYIYGDGRKSIDYERNAIKNIRYELINDSRTKATILDVKEVNMQNFPVDQNITEAWNRLHELTKIGTQYEWIAKYAKINSGLEIGVENGLIGVSYANTALKKYGKLMKTNDIHKFKVDKAKSSSDTTTIFGDLRFPIIDITEIEMKKNLETLGGV